MPIVTRGDVLPVMQSRTYKGNHPLVIKATIIRYYSIQHRYLKHKTISLEIFQFHSILPWLFRKSRAQNLRTFSGKLLTRYNFIWETLPFI